MKRIDNRGFSLIDLLIAIAVMALLMGPIIAQTLQTVKVSSQAKEKQYVVENVEDTIEYFRGVDITSLNSVGDTLADPYFGGDITVTYDGDVTCKLYDQDGNELLDGGSPVTITYHQTNYSIPAVQLGKEKNSYDRVIVKNDLMTKIVAEGYQVDFENLDYGVDTLTGFEVLSDNMTVKYGDATNKTITGVVCRPNPNGKLTDVTATNIINMQYIDSSNLAIITSEATTMDYQVERDLRAVLVQYAAEHPASALGQLSDDAKQLNDYITNLLENQYALDKFRKINVSITANDDPTNPGTPKGWHVLCTVEYYIDFNPGNSSSTGIITPFNGSARGTLKYTALDRIYYTEQPVNVYMIYEPLLATTNSSSFAYYAEKDYLTFTTDKFTSGNETGYDASTVYLIASTNNWAAAMGATTDTYSGATYSHDPVDGNTINFDYHMYRTYSNGAFQDVKIYINQDKTTVDPTLQTPIDIYTNIGVRSLVTDTHSNDERDYTQYKENKITDQFVVSDFDRSFDHDNGTLSAYDYANIQPWYIEDNYDAGSGGVYQVSVVYSNPELGDTYINGTKGAN